MKLKCPSVDLSQEQRVQKWQEQIIEYIHNPYMEKILALFGYKHVGADWRLQLKNLLDFVSENWDFRKELGSRERWTIEDRNNIVLEHKEEVLEAADRLGMIHRKEHFEKFDYIIPLGGARAATYDRIKEAYDVWEKQKSEGVVVALAAMRILGEIEIPFVKTYLKEVQTGTTTEYDVACAAMQEIFHVGGGSILSKYHEDDLNLRWYCKMYEEKKIAVLSAPSSCPQKRRANSRDTFIHFLNQYQVPVGSRILLTTSSIYINYQLPEFIDLAIKYNLEIVFSGSGALGKRNPVVSNYLQELKGSIQAICNSLKRIEAI